MSFMGMKTALVTGASGDIGAAVAEKLAENGYCVAIHYFNSRENAEKLCMKISQNGGNAMVVKADISEPEQVKRMFGYVSACFGNIDLLVNNAAVDFFSLATDVTDEQWRRLLGVNLDGCFYCCREALKSMVKEQCGNIINISSMWGVTGASCEVPYSTSKAAIIGMTKALAKEYGSSGIRVNCIAPGLIDTKMNDAADKDALKAIVDDTPCGRMGSVEDIANAVLFLADDRSSFITGQIIGVNGGFLI